MTPTQIILEALDEIAAVRHALAEVHAMHGRADEGARLHESADACENIAMRIRAGQLRWADAEVAAVMA
jgi:hypothetical protein